MTTLKDAKMPTLKDKILAEEAEKLEAEKVKTKVGVSDKPRKKK